MLTIADELKRARAIADIGDTGEEVILIIQHDRLPPDGECFVQADFRTDHMARLGGVKEEGELEEHREG